jgi:hypothetical protein
VQIFYIVVRRFLRRRVIFVVDEDLDSLNLEWRDVAKRFYIIITCEDVMAIGCRPKIEKTR